MKWRYSLHCVTVGLVLLLMGFKAYSIQENTASQRLIGHVADVAAAGRTVQTQKHTLLIGVGDYPHLPASQRLEGPRNDVAALKKLALDEWQVPEKNITVLLESEATRENILSALDQLDKDTNPGDWVYIHFSGHGTSSESYAQRNVYLKDLPDNTGGFLPYEFKDLNKQGKPLDHTSLVKQMVVGRWDLKPRLMKLDQKGVQTFVVVDACYSEHSTRTHLVPEHDSFRFLPVYRAPEGDGHCEHCIDSQAVAGYSYQNTVVFYASANDQKAEEIDSRLIREGIRSTLSNKPQGLFTESLLRAFQALDESQASFEQLFQTTRQLLHNQCGGKCLQDPGAIPTPEESTVALLQRRAINIASMAQPRQSVTCGNEKTSIAISSAYPHLREQVKLNRNFELTDSHPDIVLREHNDGLGFYSQGGAKIVDLDRVRGHFRGWLGSRAWLRTLDCTIAQRDNDFELFLRAGDGLQGDTMREGESLYLSVNVEADARLLVLDIDPKGEVYVLYPIETNELQAVPGAQLQQIPSKSDKPITVASPFGQDSLWVMAFSDKKDLKLLQKFQQNESPVHIRSPLMEQLRNRLTQSGGVSQQRLNIFTVGR